MASELPNYVTEAQPIPQGSRAAWFKNTAPAYAGIMLWFVFWQDVVVGGGTPGGVLSTGVMTALLGLVIAALLCHFLFYLVPGLLGMKTGLPLYVVGTSTYGVRGGFLMPGFLMGLLQFGWVAVNAFAVSALLCKCLKLQLLADGSPQVPGLAHGLIAAGFAILGAFVGLKGIKYVARVATFLPLIPLAVLIILLVITIAGVGDFTPDKITSGPKEATTAMTASGRVQATAAEEAKPAEGAKAEEAKAEPASPLSTWGVIAILSTYVVGFFATAGAAGTDFGMNNRNSKDVQLGGLTGIALATVVAGGLAILIVAGAYGGGKVLAASLGKLNPIDLLESLMGGRNANIIMILLAVSSFPPVCFSAFIAANSFKTTMPKVNPWLSVGIGTAVAIVLAVTGVVGKVIFVFVVIGASFGPVCGAMAADYLLAGRKWAGPRAGFNPAGWISWVVGFAVGAAEFIAQIPGLGGLKGVVPVPPVAAFVVGFVLYLILAKIGLTSRSIAMPSAAPAAAPAPAEGEGG